jgi:hypothetical protein
VNTVSGTTRFAPSNLLPPGGRSNIAERRAREGTFDSLFFLKVSVKKKYQFILPTRSETTGDLPYTQGWTADAFHWRLSRTWSARFDPCGSVEFLYYINVFQAGAGDIAQAQKTVNLIQDRFSRSDTEASIADYQIKGGDAANALKTLALALKDADLIQEDATNRDIARKDIAIVQVAAGDLAGAQKTVELIQDVNVKMQAQPAIAEAKAKIGGSTLGPAVWIWLNILDDHSRYSVSPLNTGIFLDLAGYLRSLSPSDDPRAVFKTISSTIKKMVSGQKAIDEERSNNLERLPESQVV